ncbi:LytR/AlgR family response regulator transcription factor [Vibrio atypicus]|uniref:LytR/AlgR family response regulator transcription factor n=1 Tax=Vibrio atypicus TaxID=558271 RepID=UPI00135692BB|nr:LytTR family DNA-binding domain-containing protein [Vibrio atypicus]
MTRKAVTAIIADDEPLLRFHLNKTLGEVWPELDIKGIAENGEQALALVEQHQPDIAFLDIRMPKCDGMQAAKQLMKKGHSTLVVFVTAYDEYAIQAFEANAVDYLLKPLTEERLDQCVAKLKQRLDRQSETIAPDMAALLQQMQQFSTKPEPSYLSWIRANKGDDIHLISVSDVLYFKAEDKYVCLYKREQGKKMEYLLRTSLKELITQLDPELFWQIHRSTIVNVSVIEKVKKEFTGKMVAVVDGEKLPISRAMQARFNSAW